jgi:hypothetical protein
MQERTQKHPDIHFGKDGLEIFCKFFCWTLTFLLIWINYANDANDVFNKSLAVSVLAFSLSCLSSIFLSIRDKESKVARVFHVIFVVGFAITTLTSLSITAFECKFFSKELCFYHLYFFGIFLFLVLVDFLVVYTDIDTIPKETDARQKAYARSLNGGR